MRILFRKFLFLFFGFVLLISNVVATKSLNKDVYGFLANDYAVIKKGLCKFPISNPSALEFLFETPYLSACAGAYANGRYYVYLYDPHDYNLPLSISTIDLETGVVSEVKKMDAEAPLWKDMSYDYSTGRMFAICSSGVGATTDLLSFDLTTMVFQKVATLNDVFVTLACDYKGNLYGVTSYWGELFKINKSTGVCTLIGDTGEKPTYTQSMEFDHTDNTLYWSGCADDNSFFATVDISTGASHRIGLIGNHAQTIGLYVPFTIVEDDAPAKVDDFAIVPMPNGVLKATLSWKNPSLTNGGGNLTSITSVDIYRDGGLVKSFSGNNVGESMLWIDELEAAGKYDYEIVVSNNVGVGAVAYGSMFVGVDLPSAVLNLRLSSVENKPSLTWEKPNVGMQGGWFDESTLRYKVVRLPDNKLVADGISDTYFIDHDIQYLDVYSYEVTTISGDREGGKVISEDMTFGEYAKMPYYYDFSNRKPFALWTVIDANEDGKTWKISADDPLALVPTLLARYSYSSTKDADDYMITPCFQFENGRNYKLRFRAKKEGYSNIEKLKVTMGNDKTAAAQNVVLADYTAINHTNYVEYMIDISVEESGAYYIGFYCYTPKGQQLFLDIGSVAIEAADSVDLSAIAITGPQNPLLNKEYSYDFKIRNIGTEAQDNFTLQIVDQNGEVLSNTIVNQVIEPEQIKSFVVKWKPLSYETIAIRGRIVIDGDANDLNNVTAEALSVNVQDPNALDIFVIGSKKKTSNAMPIRFDFKTGAGQTLYLASEIRNSEGGSIEKVVYHYKFEHDFIVDKHIKLYLCNTSLTSLKDDFIGLDQFKLVFDGNITMPKTDNELVITLDSPFLYGGGNLCVMVERVMDSDYYSPGVFYTSDTDNVNPNRTRVYADDIKSFAGQPKIGKLYSSISDITLIMKTVAGGKLKVAIVDQEGKPVDGLLVTTTDGAYGMTNAEGVYTFEYMSVGNYTLNVSGVGYEDVKLDNIEVVQDETTDVEVSVVAVPSFKVSGRVLSPNSSPLLDANVKIDGYNQYEVLTDEEGRFEIEGVYKSDNYELSINAERYKLFTKHLEVDGNVMVDDIVMSDILLPAANVYAERCVCGEDIGISWMSTSELKNFRYDSGIVSSQLSNSDNSPNMVLGSVHRTPAVLSGMSWQTTDNTESHETVNVFVLDLDENGLPTKDILFSEYNVPNKDWAWSSCQFPKLVNAPNGFMIAVSSNKKTSLDLALDQGDDNEYPFTDYTQYTGNLNSGVFIAINDMLFFENLHIRAEGAVIEEDMNFENRYNVYRMEKGQEDSYEHWFLVYGSPFYDNSIGDIAWKKLYPGMYVYAVRSVYTNELSAPSYSNEVYKHVSVKELDARLINLYPNPATDYFMIEGGDIEQVRVYDNVGKLLVEQTSTRVNTVNWTHGTYIVEVVVDGKIVRSKVVIR